MTAVDNIKVRQTWIEEELEEVSSELGVGSDEAFLMFGAATLLDCNPSEIEAADIVDGGQDKQIDLIHIDLDEDKGVADIMVMQSKNSKGFESSVVIKMKNGLDWIFEKSKSALAKLKNESFKEKIMEIRDIRKECGASNISLHVYHVTNGDKSKLSDEYLQEASGIAEKYGNLGFDEFVFDQLGAHELVELMNAADRSKRKVDVDIPILYDTNRASLVEYVQGDTKSIICTVRGEDIAKIAQSEPRDSIFDMNVRPYYGSKGRVNKDILATCQNDDAAKFWFLNNGVTMVCEHFDFNRDPDEPLVKVKDAQIVNGCQTTVTLREAYEKGELDQRTRILLRLYSTDNQNLIDKITLTTNNQNKITDRDLRANDSVQQDLEIRMKDRYGYLYERKNKQYRTVRRSQKHLVIPSPKAAQAYLAIVRAKPANARGYLGAIWSDFYAEIFQNASVVDLIVAYKIHQICHKQAMETKTLDAISQTERDCRVYGVYHIARVMGYHLLQDRWGHGHLQEVEELLGKLDDGKVKASDYMKALKKVVELRKKHDKEHLVPAMYFKNSISQKELNSMLYKV